MEKDQKNFKIIATYHKLSDTYPEDEILKTNLYYRYGKSEKEVIAHLRKSEDLHDYDNYYGSTSYVWRFWIEEIVEEFEKVVIESEQLSLFDFIDKSLCKSVEGN